MAKKKKSAAKEAPETESSRAGEQKESGPQEGEPAPADAQPDAAVTDEHTTSSGPEAAETEKAAENTPNGDGSPIARESSSKGNPEPATLGSSDKDRALSAASEQIGRLKAKLENVENERDDIQDQYDELLDKVSHIRTTLGQRLKSDAAELARVKQEFSELSEKFQAAQDALAATKEAAEREESKHQSEKLALEKKIKESTVYEMALSEQKSANEILESKLAQLTEDVKHQSDYAEHYRSAQREQQSKHEERTKQLTQEIEALTSKLDASTAEAHKLSSEKTKLEEALQAEQEKCKQSAATASSVDELKEQVREKNIIIGKLRHEAVILNEHLTNALRIVKKDSEGQTVDKELVSNLIIQFVTIPRGDTKKFEVLQLISSTLGWDEAQRVQAGLSKANTGNGDNPSSIGGFLGRFAEFMERESRKST